ncbi:MAG: BrnA antitoxin family protein [Cyanobacteriota bacterium]|nr:BrnA antitoxin family protein [Cyanobacteriota bacterium]
MKNKFTSRNSQTDWERLDAMTDEDIDFSDCPPLTEEFFENATLRIPAVRARNLIELDADVMAWFREQDAEYRTTINSILRRYVESRK